VVCPAAIVTLAGEIVTLLGSLLESETVTLPAAACGSVTANGVLCPSPTVVFEGSPIAPAVTTVTFAVVLGIFGAAVLAVIVLEPRLTAVTGTFTVVAPTAKLTLAGTVATLVVPELRLIVSPPAGAAPESVRTRFCVERPVIVNVGGVKFIVAFTCTVASAVVTPVPDAAIVADPTFTPCTEGWLAGVVCPAKIVMLAGEIVTFVGSLLTSAIVRSATAGVDKLTANVADAPKFTDAFDGSRMVAGAVTITCAVASGIFGRLLAWITAVPEATAVTGTVTVLVP
jgi:hypothetical protein